MPQHTGNQHTTPTHFIDVDAHGVRRLGMLAASGKPQTEPGSIQHHIGRNQDYDADEEEHIQSQATNIEGEGGVIKVHLAGLAAVEPLCRNQRQGRCQQV